MFEVIKITYNIMYNVIKYIEVFIYLNLNRTLHFNKYFRVIYKNLGNSL